MGNIRVQKLHKLTHINHSTLQKTTKHLSQVTMIQSSWSTR